MLHRRLSSYGRLIHRSSQEQVVFAAPLPVSGPHPAGHATGVSEHGWSELAIKAPLRQTIFDFGWDETVDETGYMR